MTTLGSPTMLEPTVPRGDTEWTLGWTSVVPVPDMAPTGLAIIEFVLLILLYRMLSTVFSMKTSFFFMPSCFPFLLGEFDSVRFFA